MRVRIGARDRVVTLTDDQDVALTPATAFAAVRKIGPGAYVIAMPFHANVIPGVRLTWQDTGKLKHRVVVQDVDDTTERGEITLTCAEENPVV